VDKAGRTVDFFLSRNRAVTAAKTFLRNAMKNRRTPTKITLDAYAASHRAVREMKETATSSKSAIQPILEQSRRTGPPASQTADAADARIQTIRQCGSHYYGIELADKIKKGQFKTGKFGSRKSTMSELWNAALGA
jgi:transposase-like protein